MVDQFDIGFETDVNRNFEVIYSPDNSKMLILKEEITDSREQIINVKIYEVESNKKICDQKLNTDSENQVPTGYDYLLTNEGRFCYLFETSENINGMQIISEEYSKNKTVMIPSVNTLINLKIEIVNNLLLCSGEILEGKRQAKTNDEPANMGFFLLVINPKTAEIKNQSYDYLSSELQTKLNYKDKNYYYTEEGIKSYSFSHKAYKHYKTIYLNGSIYVIKYHGYTWRHQNSFGVETTYPSAKEIIVLKYNNFKLEWMSLIPRKNSEASKMGMNFIISKKLHLFYFENPENLKTPDIKNYDHKTYQSVKASSSVLVNTVIEEDGKIIREEIKSDKDWYLPPNFNAAFLSHSKSTIISTFDKKKRRFDLISVKD